VRSCGISYETMISFHSTWVLMMELQEFAADLYAGKLALYYKSEPVPAEVRPGDCVLL
jgi:hypothetical protein